MPRNVKKIGEIFVENGTISGTTLQRALVRATKKQSKLGHVLEDMGVVTGDEIAQALANQFGYKRIKNLVKYQLTPELQNLFSVEVAFRYMLFPLKIKKNKLYIALADPTDTKIISNISTNLKLEIVPFIATRSDIVAAINKNYLGKEKSLSERKTILVADDYLDTSVDLQQVLSRHGYRVIIANDGIEAFKMTLSESPCVVIAGKDLPKLGGYRLYEAIKNLPETKGIPVILLSDGANIEEEALAYKHGFFEFVTKPINQISLVTRVKKAIHTFDKTHK